jgi:anionic cell wall polymer biosynthesis LytR-Cps2A-Psr (LCP) family protein
VSGDQEHYGQDPYAGGYRQQGQQGYDPYAQPPQPQAAQQDYDPAYYQGQQGYAPYPDPQYPQQGYAQQPYPPDYQQPGYQGHEGYQTYQQPGYQDPAAYPQPTYDEQRYQVPQPRHEEPPPAPEQPSPPTVPPRRDEEAPREFQTEQFAFIEDEDEQAEDVIDWLKFSESRTERRDERKRRGRTRVVALVVLLVLALVGGVGYLWQAGKLPGFGKGAAATQATGAQKRDVIVVHLRQVDSNDSSTALLVGNETTGKGTTVLLPNSLSVNADGGTTTLGKSVVDQGAGPTRDALNALLGANIQGSWRLDTPYLEILVDAVGGITVDTDTTVGSGGKTLVNAGQQQDLNGQAAVAYASYRGPGEAQNKQLTRFGQVMQAVLMKLPSDAATATKIVDSLGAIPDPSLSDAQLGATLAHLADQEKSGHYATAMLPVQPDGTLSEQATNSVVKDVLGGTVKNTNPSGVPRVAVRDATGGKKAAAAAQVAVVNSGYTYVDGGSASPQARSQVLYSADNQAQTAKELAKTLGLPDSAVAKGQGASNADVTVVLGGDYKG